MTIFEFYTGFTVVTIVISLLIATWYSFVKSGRKLESGDWAVCFIPVANLFQAGRFIGEFIQGRKYK